MRLRLGLSSLDALKAHVQTSSGTESGSNGGVGGHKHPRWTRINTLKGSFQRQLATSFTDYVETKSLDELLRASAHEKLFYVDPTIESLIALPPGHDVSTWKAYKDGAIILQDKASCFPAALLDPVSIDEDVIDATAAPGNKTTHLAALLGRTKSRDSGRPRRVIAFERNAMRFSTLQKMVKTAGAENVVDVRHQDFLTVDPNSDDMRNVTAILLDPSCSGSGIIGRDNDSRLVLPEAFPKDSSVATSKKRKRLPGHDATDASTSSPPENAEAEQWTAVAEDEDESALKARLEALSAFQLKILSHAMSFPRCRRITYSTCSVHAIENENVVLKALNQSEVDGSGWRILRRDEQISGLGDWQIRGNSEECTDREIATACIRCEKGTKEGTMGFFVAGFVRQPPDGNSLMAKPEEQQGQQGQEDQWEGFGD